MAVQGRCGRQRLALRAECDPGDVSDDDLIADCQQVTNLIAKCGLVTPILLEADVDRMELFVALYERAVWATPYDVRRELAIQDVRVVLVMACLQPRRDGLDRRLGVSVPYSHCRASSHGRFVLAARHRWSMNGNIPPDVPYSRQTPRSRRAIDCWLGGTQSGTTGLESRRPWFR
jgi:hypothetical protein